MDIFIIVAMFFFVGIIVVFTVIIRWMTSTHKKFKPQLDEQRRKAKKLGIKSTYLGGIFEEKDYSLNKEEQVITYFPGILTITSSRIFGKVSPTTISVMVTNQRIILPSSSFRTIGNDNHEQVSVNFSDNAENKNILFRNIEEKRYLGLKKGAILYVIIPKKSDMEPNYLNATNMNKKYGKEGYIVDRNWFFPKNTHEFISIIKKTSLKQQ